MLILALVSIDILSETSRIAPLYATYNSNVEQTQSLQIYSDRSFEEMMNDAMQRMCLDMLQTKYNNDPNLYFVEQMIPHHQGALDMVKILMLYDPKDKDVRNLSTKILTTQTAEITEMNEWVSAYQVTKNNHKTPPETDDNTYAFTSKKNIKHMHHAMSNVVQINNPSYDFIAMMIPHHQGAIDMATVYLEVGNDAQLMNLAQRIITGQRQEIFMMQYWLDNYRF